MKILRVAFLLLAIATVDCRAADAAYPTHPIRTIVPFTGGSTLDIMARQVADNVGSLLKQNIVVDNRAGANGIIGAELVAKSPPDGYTMLMTTGSFTGNMVFYKKLPYDGLRDFAPVTQIARSYGLVLVVSPALPVKSVKELVDYAKRNPGKLSYASSGYGNMTHVVAEWMKAVAVVDVVHVPYKGSGPALTDVIGRQVDMTFISTVAVQPFIRDGRVRPLALTGGERSPVLPDLPTFKELGYTEFEMTGWYGLWFPARTPAAIVHRMQAEVAKAIATPKMKAALDLDGLAGVASTPAEFARFLREDIALQTRIAKQAGIQQQ